MADEPVYIDDDHAAIVGFAETYFDDDDERADFVSTLMERRGYTRVETWGPPAEPEPERRPAARQRPAAPAAPAQAARKSPYFKR